MQRLRSQALDAFESSDYTAAITFLDKILEVSFLDIAAGKPDTCCVLLWGTFMHFDMLCITSNLERIRSHWSLGF